MDPESWMGPQPMIWAAELHQYRGKYFHFATFTNRKVNIDTVRGNVINRRASHVMVSEQPESPFLFKTKTGKLGMIWTSWVLSDYVQGVA